MRTAEPRPLLSDAGDGGTGRDADQPPPGGTGDSVGETQAANGADEGTGGDADNPNFPNTPLGQTVLSCAANRDFAAVTIGVQFLSPILVARRDATVTGEHWTEGVNVNEPNIADGSIKPAVILIAGRGAKAMRLRIRVIRSQNVDPTAPVSGSLGGLNFKSIADCPTSVGEHTVDAEIVTLPSAIQCDKGDAQWGMDVNPFASVVLGSTRLEVVTILDQPMNIYAKGVWIEVLRTLCQGGAVGLNAKRAAGAGVVRLCHGPSMGCTYDTIQGAPSFNASGAGSASFQLGRYITPGSKTVNCYDQASAVSCLTGALRVSLDYIFAAQFGFINSTDLVGVGSCNNPFFKSNGSSATVTSDDPSRTSFGNDAFTRFQKGANNDISGVASGIDGAIGDACAGPAMFT
jgi:hypothetical protein